jgi:hypothetical protein
MSLQKNNTTNVLYPLHNLIKRAHNVDPRILIDFTQCFFAQERRFSVFIRRHNEQSC